MHRTPTEQAVANVRAEMARNNVKRPDLAAKLDMTDQALARRLAGKTVLTIDEAFAVAEILGLPADQILPTRPAAA